MAKPKIKSIEIEARQWTSGDFGYKVEVHRWSHFGRKGQVKKFLSAVYYHPSAATVTRCRRAQEAMVAQKEEESAG